MEERDKHYSKQSHSVVESVQGDGTDPKKGERDEREVPDSLKGDKGDGTHPTRRENVKEDRTNSDKQESDQVNESDTKLGESDMGDESDPKKRDRKHRDKLILPRQSKRMKLNQKGRK